jgi:hypothetical protein
MFVIKARSFPLDGLWPYPLTLDKAGKAFQKQTLQLIMDNRKITPVKRFITLGLRRNLKQ